ncbi:MAG: FG-GAP-like repeat-containing protein, partial [Planctomycetota bacterium]
MRKYNLHIAAAVCVLMMTLVVPATADTHYVSPGQSIQAAIDDANDGDEIEVAPGIYVGAINFNGKAIRLYSSGGQDVTTIDANGAYHTVRCVSGEDANTILEGFTITGGNATYGGGMENYYSSPTVTNSTFSGNSAVKGGGICNSTYSRPKISNCIFSGNSADNWGGGMYNYNSSPELSNCTFSGNTAPNGGGMYNLEGSSPMVTNCIFTNNTAVIDGGGLFNNVSSPTVTNCTFSGNTAASSGGGMYNNVGSPTVTNCILWGDTAPTGPEIYGGSPIVTYCDVQGGYTGTGNIAKNPLLRTAGKADLCLAPWSPCIDNGNNDEADANGTDIAGLERVVDGDCNGTAIVDIGAHEFRHTYAGDFDLNCYVNFSDFAVLAMAWLSDPLNGNWQSAYDISVPADGLIDFKDVDVLAGNWLHNVDMLGVCLDPNVLRDIFGLNARGAADVLGEICGITDSLELEEVLYGCGYEPAEYLEFTALEWVEKFAPILYFDQAYEGLPMSAQVYFETVLAPSLSYYSPGWADALGWDGQQYYSTIQTGDVDGDGKAELLARSSIGMQTYKFNSAVNSWELVASGNPDWSDSQGWDGQQYYSTIQTADVNGDGKAELLARSGNGMQTYKFNSAGNSWDLVASGNPKYYSTIQTGDVDGDGKAELLARSGSGMQTYKFNSAGNSWELVASGNPAWSDAEGWGYEKYYSTIQTGDVDGDGKAELLARSGIGMQTYKFNSAGNSWDLVASSNPAWSDAAGWDQEKYYSTIQTGDVDGDGKAELLVRSSIGMQTYKFNSAGNSWELLASGNPDWSDAGGWDQEKYYSTIQTGDVDGDGKAELLARSGSGMETYKFNSAGNSWERVAWGNPNWSDAGGWDYEKYYSTIQTGDADGDGKAELLARSSIGMQTYGFDANSNLWVNTTEGFITWRPDLDPLNGPCGKPGVECLWGRDDCTCGMQNNDFAKLVNGEVPTYYKVISDIDSDVNTGAKGRLRIYYT